MDWNAYIIRRLNNLYLAHVAANISPYNLASLECIAIAYCLVLRWTLQRKTPALQLGWTYLSLWFPAGLAAYAVVLFQRYVLEGWIGGWLPEVLVSGHNNILDGLIGAALMTPIGWLVARISVGRAVLQQNWGIDSQHRRGAAVQIAGAAQELARHAKARQKALKEGHCENLTVMLAGLLVPPECETRHFKIMGTTGSGKSTAIRELMRGAALRGDRTVIADPDGGYLSRFYNEARGDIVLNPFDVRSASWDIFAELTQPFDYDHMARSLIADHGDRQSEWHNYARTFLASLLKQCKANNIAGIGELNALIHAERAELAVLLSRTPAAAFLEAGNEKMFSGVRATAADAVQGLAYLAETKGAMFSIKKWIGGGRGWLFLPYQADQIAAIRSLVTTWMRIAIFSAMSLPEGDARIWFVVDELDALGKIDGLADALARLRKFGGRCVLGFQSIGPLMTLYGEGFSAAMTENCGNTLILRCSASARGGTSQFASQLIGQREVLRASTSNSSHRSLNWRSGSSLGEGVSTTYSVQIESAVLAAQIEQLADRQGYLKFAIDPAWRQLGFAFDNMPLRTTPFDPT